MQFLTLRNVFLCSMLSFIAKSLNLQWRHFKSSEINIKIKLLENIFTTLKCIQVRYLTTDQDSFPSKSKDFSLTFKPVLRHTYPYMQPTNLTVSSGMKTTGSVKLIIYLHPVSRLKGSTCTPLSSLRLRSYKQGRIYLYLTSLCSHLPVVINTSADFTDSSHFGKFIAAQLMKKVRHFMEPEPEGFLACSQKSSIRPYTDPNQSSPQSQTLRLCD
jgi:hypothetical protein